MPYWIVGPEWKGQVAYIIGGGPSVLQQDLSLLRGRRVIVVNSSYETYPSADILFFADSRWWQAHMKRPALAAFKGRMVTCNANVGDDRNRLLRLRRVMPNLDPKHGPFGPGYAEKRDSIVSNRTSLQGAMNLAGHLGVARIVLLGADMQRAEDGTTHHHSPHQWKNKPGNETWDLQLEQLRLIVRPLYERRIQVINASPRSRLDFWPRMTLEKAIQDHDASLLGAA